MRALLLDLDDTLLDFHAAERYALSQTLTAFHIPVSEEVLQTYSSLNRTLWQSMEAGKIPKETLLKTRFSAFLDLIGVQAEGECMGKEYERWLSGCTFTVAGVFDTLDVLKKQYALYVVSNGTSRVQRKRMAESGLLPYFDGIFLSEEVGYAKPDARYFESVFASIPYQKGETLLVGDSLSADVAGANNCGIRSVWINRFGRENTTGVKVDVELRNICDLPFLLPHLQQ